MKRGPFEVTGSKIVYQNPWIKVREDEIIRPNGEKGIFGVVDAGTGVTVVALDKDNEVYIIREFHYAIETNDYILPSGGIGQGEEPLSAAKRELEEEAGVTAKKWTFLGKYNPLTMILNSASYFFLAEELEEGEQGEEEKGLIKIEKIPLKTVVEMAVAGELNHSGSVISILLTARLKEL